MSNTQDVDRSTRKKLISKRFMWTGVFALLALGVFIVADTAVTMAQVRRGQVEGTQNPLAHVLLRFFNQEPNLLVEDHVKISCEPEFSVKVFTVGGLKNAEFKVTDETGAIVFGTALEPSIRPLWHKVWFRNLSPFPLPEKILVTMVATADDGKEVTHTLIVEPDCKESRILVKNATVIFPVGKILVNPDPPDDPTRIRIPLPPLVMTIPQHMMGKPVNVQVKIPDGTTVGQGNLDTIDTEMLSMELSGGGVVIPVPPAPPSGPPLTNSFFDVFYEIQIGDLPPLIHPVRLIDATPLEQGLQQDVTTFPSHQ